jgi:hypothetical protein
MNGNGLGSFYKRQAALRAREDRRAERMTTLKYLAVVVASIVAVIYIVLNPGAI